MAALTAVLLCADGLRAGDLGIADVLGVKIQARPGELPQFGPVVPELEPINAAMTNYLVTNSIKAGTIALMKDGKWVLRQAYGWRDRQLTTLTHPETVMRISGISASLAVCAINKLVAEGRLSLDTPVYKFAGIEPYTGVLGDSRMTQITVRHCLQNSSGFDDENYDDWRPIQDMKLTRPLTTTDWIRWALARPLLFTPGSSHASTRSGLLYMGRVVEKVTGKSFVDYLRQDMLSAYGITNIIPSRSRPEDRPENEIWYDSEVTQRSVADYPGNALVRAADGGGWLLEADDTRGGLSASAPDLCRFLQHYYLSGSPRTSLYGYGYGWGMSWLYSVPGTSSVIFQQVDLNGNSLNALEYAILCNRGGMVGQAYDGVLAAARGISSWPALGGGAIQWSAPMTVVNESAGSVALPLSRTGSANRTVKVSYTTYGRVTTANRFAPRSGILCFAPGEMSKTVIIPIIQDAEIRPDEEFTLELVSASGGAWLGEQVSATVRIVDDNGLAGLTPVAFTSPPANQCVGQGENVTLNIGVSGSAPLAVQWMFNGMAMPGETNLSLVLTNVGTSQSGCYSVMASNILGSTSSPAAELLVLGEGALVRGGLTAEVFTNVPAWSVGELVAATNYPDHPDAVFVVDQAETPLNYGDFYGVRLTGYVVPPVTGDYVFYLCSDGQSVLWLSTNAQPENARQIAYDPTWANWRRYDNGAFFRGTPPSNRSGPIRLEAGKPYALIALMQESGGGDNLSIAWQMPGEPPPTNGAPPIPGACLAYTKAPPGITSSALDQRVNLGENTTFSIRFTGSPRLYIQWYHEGLPLPNQTNASLALVGVAPSDLGYYFATVKNSFGMVTSRVAQLRLAGSPVIPLPPLDQTAIVGETISFRVLATGTDYQWKFNGAGLVDGDRISGASGNVLTIANVRPTDAGSYSVLVRNDLGSAASPAANLTVLHSRVESWGDNRNWIDQTGSYSGPATVPLSLSNVAAVAAGWRHSLALQSDGSVAAWGENTYGQATVPPGATNVVAISSGSYHSLALRADGTVVAWGLNHQGQGTVPVGLSNVVSLAAGGWHNLALKSDGSLVAWGNSAEGQTGIPPGLTGKISAISAGADFNAALLTNGSVVAWGRNTEGETNVPLSATNIIRLSCGAFHILALRADGSVVAWGAGTNPQTYGYPHYRQSIVPTSLSNVVGVAAGVGCSFALTADGTLVGWGKNEDGETYFPPDLRNVLSLSVGATHVLTVIGSSALGPLEPPKQLPILDGERRLRSLLNTRTGRHYMLEFAESFPPATWTPMWPLVLGDGGAKTLIDTNAPCNMRFYRVQQR